MSKYEKDFSFNLYFQLFEIFFSVLSSSLIIMEAFLLWKDNEQVRSSNEEKVMRGMWGDCWRL